MTRRASPKAKFGAGARAKLKAELRARATFQHIKAAAIGTDPIFANGSRTLKLSARSKWLAIAKAYDRKHSAQAA